MRTSYSAIGSPRTHRRLSSYPEAFLAARRASATQRKRLQDTGNITDEKQQSIELQSLKLSQDQQPQKQQQKPSQPATATAKKGNKRFLGHRRIASTGAIDPASLQTMELPGTEGGEVGSGAEPESQMVIPSSSSAQPIAVS